MRVANPPPKSVESRVDHVRWLSPTAYVLRFDRHNSGFEPGQYLSVGPLGGDVREYSIYSPPQASYFEILVRKVDEGHVSKALCDCAPGEPLTVRPPNGEFVTPDDRGGRRFLFVGTGTGIAPYHAMLGAYPDLDYQLLHGVSTLADRFEHEHYDQERVVTCLSKGTGGDFSGRVTAYLREHPPERDTLCYLCGSCDMIYDSFALLSDAGVPRQHVHVETYY